MNHLIKQQHRRIVELHEHEAAQRNFLRVTCDSRRDVLLRAGKLARQDNRPTCESLAAMGGKTRES